MVEPAGPNVSYAIEISRYSGGYNQTDILNELSFHVPMGESVAILGENGTGKTTFFRALLQLLPKQTGELRILGRQVLSSRDKQWVRSQIGYVPQTQGAGKFPISAEDSVLLGRWGKSFSWGIRPSRNDRELSKYYMEASEVSKDKAATIEVDNTPYGYIKAARKLAAIWGTEAEESNWEQDLGQLTAEIEQAARQHETSKKKVISQVYMTPLLKWLGYEVVGEFGPDEMTPTQLAKLAELKPDLIIDNVHMPQGFSEISKETKRIELRSYPSAEQRSVEDILRHNAEQLGLSN
ncbi:ATP-binding cassette domain-containing protein [Paenibacillus sp. IHBB 3054]|uniref:ATP-binding cassette domain-containing protein n=1 Tax=Paenibacillus sp. IHBB 3054 TaxID=3425689 RepID=UPI003F662388